MKREIVEITATSGAKAGRVQQIKLQDGAVSTVIAWRNQGPQVMTYPLVMLNVVELHQPLAALR
jgi:hypothetical protein